MDDILMTVIAFSGGILLGVIFYGGLWLTVQHGVAARFAALWFTGSFFLRITITLAGFYFIADGHWQRLLICLLGFMLARILITRLTRPSGKGGVL